MFPVNSLSVFEFFFFVSNCYQEKEIPMESDISSEKENIIASEKKNNNCKWKRKQLQVEKKTIASEKENNSLFINKFLPGNNVSARQASDKD